MLLNVFALFFTVFEIFYFIKTLGPVVFGNGAVYPDWIPKFVNNSVITVSYRDNLVFVYFVVLIYDDRDRRRSTANKGGHGENAMPCDRALKLIATLIPVQMTESVCRVWFGAFPLLLNWYELVRIGAVELWRGGDARLIFAAQSVVCGLIIIFIYL